MTLLRLAILLSMVIPHQFSVTGEQEYVNYEVVPEWEMINRYNISQLECKQTYRSINNNKYITADERYRECLIRVMTNVLDDKQCYLDDYVDNPCEIKCFEMGKSDECRASVETVRKFRFIGKQCGPDHFCNDYGCCDKRVTTTAPIGSTPTTVGQTATTRVTEQSPTTGPTDTTTASVVTRPSEPFVCPRPGDFPDERDISSYWHCYYAVEVLECQENEIFDKWNEKCVFDWHRYIKCSKEGYFQNPYDCHKFYWCYPDPTAKGKLKVDFFTCADDVNGHPMIWDDKKVSCVANQNDTVQCHDLPLPDDGNKDKDIPNDSLLENDIEMRVIFEQNIECQTEGRFRNPFDCHKWYRCYYSSQTDVLLSVQLYKCKDELMVFDDNSGKCIDESLTPACLNKQIPGPKQWRNGGLQSYAGWEKGQLSNT